MRMKNGVAVSEDAGGVASRPIARVDLYWLPLGAGGHSVRLNGRAFEWFAARIEHRDRCDLYHSGLEVDVPEGRFVIEQAPIRDGGERGVVAEGAVGTSAAGRFRLFRYEVRRWRDGIIPDVGEAVGVRGASATISIAQGGCWSWCRRYRRRSGDAMSCAQARCGTRTR